MSYRCIAIDPPWLERGGGRIKRGADRHYSLLKTKDMPEVIMSAPCWKPAEDSHLWLWCTNNKLCDGLWLIEQLGFRYVTNMVWVKNRFGLGQYLRGMHELCLFAVRGRLPSQSRSVPSVVFENKRQHSQKPEAAYTAFEQVSPGPRLEMFARAPRDGWTTWGNEVDAQGEKRKTAA